MTGLPPEPTAFSLITTPTARRQLAELLPEAVAFAAYEFITGPLLHEPYRLGKRLHTPLADRLSALRGTYRILYRVDDSQHTVTVLDVGHRRDVYRAH
jgi:mRNA interferase RelE/StbE